ncbi:cytochrome c oxidase subunit II [Alsobacter sp. SYSU M60028]|uniref:Cytochrome c oxidase subunit 2 n=1 Tax=Alsobacter ponti TaxID=2962936 RepID=A0ABT1LCP7_9HYPH|nr:cytochrome c oxidase subunit II [Alsobacter ponti]MCP8939244.1 cytochrome c oxidase subunit II [Alsobacter ponti]
MTRSWNRSALAAAALVLGSGGAALAAGIGQPAHYQLGLQEPVTEVAEAAHNLHTALVWIITLISLFVLALLVTVVVRFNEKKNPVASRTTHHTGLEIAWTVIPVLILVGIAIPSFRLLKLQIELPKADMTVKVYGNQWYWSYEYPGEEGGFKFDSNPLEQADAEKASQPYLLAVDNEMVVPAGKTVVLQIVGNDVIHSFSVPSLGFRMDAIPGRLNQTWFKTDREGIYYGQCSRLCGQNHYKMPIAIRVVSQANYATWLADAKKKFASAEDGAVRVAARAPAAE